MYEANAPWTGCTMYANVTTFESLHKEGDSIATHPYEDGSRYIIDRQDREYKCSRPNRSMPAFKRDYQELTSFDSATAMIVNDDYCREEYDGPETREKSREPAKRMKCLDTIVQQSIHHDTLVSLQRLSTPLRSNGHKTICVVEEMVKSLPPNNTDVLCSGVSARPDRASTASLSKVIDNVTLSSPRRVQRRNSFVMSRPALHGQVVYCKRLDNNDLSSLDRTTHTRTRNGPSRRHSMECNSMPPPPSRTKEKQV